MRTPRIYFTGAATHTSGVHSPDPTASAPVALAELRRGEVALVMGLVDGDGLEDARAERNALLTRLRDLGFVTGARCEVIARMWLGGDPLAVRIGGSTFALRRAEAAAVRVQRLPAHDRARASLPHKDAGAQAA
jgi:ferrous iron transport protein A